MYLVSSKDLEAEAVAALTRGVKQFGITTQDAISSLEATRHTFEELRLWLKERPLLSPGEQVAFWILHRVFRMSGADVLTVLDEMNVDRS